MLVVELAPKVVVMWRTLKMMTLNPQLFEDFEPLSTKNLEEICMEWAKYFLQVRNQNMQ